MSRRFHSPNIISVTFDKVRAEVLLHALEEKEIYISAGSACSSNKPQLSPTLLAMGLEGSRAASTVRFSFSRYTTQKEVDYALDTIEEIIPKLQKFTRQ